LAWFALSGFFRHPSAESGEITSETLNNFYLKINKRGRYPSLFDSQEYIICDSTQAEE